MVLYKLRQSTESINRPLFTAPPGSAPPKPAVYYEDNNNNNITNDIRNFDVRESRETGYATVDKVSLKV